MKASSVKRKVLNEADVKPEKKINMNSIECFVIRLSRPTSVESETDMVGVYDPVKPLPLNKLDFRQMILQGPNTPILSLYPWTLQGHKLRSFQKEWYQKFEWLEYSSAIDAVFCFPCRCFRGNEKNSTHYDAAFSKTGFRAWYRANEAFKKHQYSKNHTNSSTALSYYLKLKSIDCQLDIARQAAISKKEKERLENRKCMYRVIDIVICLVKSGRSLRGHDESETSTNQGLFRELLTESLNHNIALIIF